VVISVSPMAITDFTARRAAFRKLHESGCFVIPNPWDAGTARYLRHLGFQALATTSSGFAFSRGLPDADWAAPLELVLSHISEMVASLELPINADFESGYAHEPTAVAENVRRCIETGVAGLSIEDATGDRARPLYDLPLAVERMKAVREAIDESGADVLLTARAECFLVGHSEPLKESIRRVHGSGCRCTLRAGRTGARGYSGDRFGGKPEASERSDGCEHRPEGFGSCGDGRAPD